MLAHLAPSARADGKDRPPHGAAAPQLNVNLRPSSAGHGPALRRRGGGRIVLMTRRVFIPTAAMAAVPRKGRLKQSVCRWCYKDIPLEDLARESAKLGLKGMDLIGPEEWPVVQKYGLTPAMTTGGGTIPHGLNRKENHYKIDKQFRETIPKAAAAGG